MNCDFLDAHERHWEDAELLNEKERLANADHLYGMSAECGLKRLMICFGMSVGASGLPPDSDRKHADGIWDRFDAYRHGHPQGAGYALPTNNPFANWKAGQRYAAREGFDKSLVLAHREGAEIVRHMVAKARKEGLA